MGVILSQSKYPYHWDFQASVARIYIKAGKPVCVSFEGMTGVIGSFLRASIGAVCLQYTPETVQKLLTFEGLRPVWRELLEDTFQMAKEQEKQLIQPFADYPYIQICKAK